MKRPSSNMYLFSLYTALLITLATSDEQSPCLFTKSSGFLDCRNRNLTALPRIPVDTQTLDLTNNRIHHLEQGAFNCCSLITELYIANNNLNRIHYTAFQNLESLKVLDLSGNVIKRLFVDIPVSLEVLYLDNNHLANDGDIFQGRMQFVRYLSLSHTTLVRFPKFSSSFPVLQYLDLSQNDRMEIVADDLKQFKELKVLSISPRIFNSQTKAQKCLDFATAMRDRRVEVKNLACRNERTFELTGKEFYRRYKNEVLGLWFDKPDNILNREMNEANLNDIQSLVSDGLTNFFKFLLVEQSELPNTYYKRTQPSLTFNFTIRTPEVIFTNVTLYSTPFQFGDKEPIMEMGSSDAEELKRLKISYITPSNPPKTTTLRGNVHYYDRAYTFKCDLINTTYQTERGLVRAYDFKTRTMITEDKFSFTNLRCEYNTTIDRVTDQVITSALGTALSQQWLDILLTSIERTIIEPQIKNSSASFYGMYKNRVLSTLLKTGINYLQRINLNSFDISPSVLASFRDNSLEETDFASQLYNIKIYNLFNYSDHDIDYSVKEVGAKESSTLQITISTIVHYPTDNSAVLAVTSKDDPDDITNFFVNKIELSSVFEIKTINKVRKVKLVDVNVKVIESEAKHILFVIQILRKYLNMELAKESKRALTFLMGKMDFYSLNGL